MKRVKLQLGIMQYTEINDVKISGGQLEKADNSSSSGESKHITDLDTLNMTHSMMRSHRPFKTSTAVIFVTAFILTALCLPGVVAIKCYECNSKLDPRCGDTFNNYTIALVDCEQQKKNDIPHIDDEMLATYNREVDEMGEYVTDVIDKDAKPISFCRKTMQSINGEYSVVRGCGWVKNFGTLRDRTCFVRTGTNQIQMRHCVCGEKDGCNGAEQSSFSLALLILPLIPAYIFHVGG